MKKMILLMVCILALAVFVVGCEADEGQVVDSDVVDETQGVANPNFSEYDVVCTEEQKTSGACTREFVPVCGTDGVTYSNGCIACSAPVDAYNQGACENEPTQLFDHVCSPTTRTAEICTMQYDPVCGSDGMDYSNGCRACSADIVGWTRGVCQ